MQLSYFVCPGVGGGFLLDLLNELVRGWVVWAIIHWTKKENRINLGFSENAHLPLPKANTLPEVRSKCKCWFEEGVGGQFPGNLSWSRKFLVPDFFDPWRKRYLSQLIVSSRNTTAELKRRTARPLYDKRDRVITCVFCRDLHLH